MTGEEVPADDLPASVNPNASGAEVPPEDMPVQQATSGSEVPPEDLPSDHSSLGEQAKTAAEGLAHGAIGELAPAIETKLFNVNPEDIKARQQSNPNISKVSDFSGNVAPYLVPGMGVVKTAMLMGGQAALDEVGKHIMGEGDPLDAAAMHIVGTTLTGYGIGKAAEFLKPAERLANSKIGVAIRSMFSGAGEAATKRGMPAAKQLTEEELKQIEAADPGLFSAKHFSSGKKLYDKLIGAILPGVTGAVVGKALPEEYGVGWKKGLSIGYGGGLLNTTLQKEIAPYVEPLISKASQKVIGPIIMKMSQNGKFNGALQAIDHWNAAQKGNQAIEKATEAIFKGIGNKVIEGGVDEMKRQRTKDLIEDGGVGEQVKQEQEKQNFAKGGKVHSMPELEPHNAIADHWPEQNMLSAASKGRVYNYLNSIRPLKNSMKLTYDSDNKDPQKEHEYDKVIDLANNPLSVLNKIKDGTLLPSHVKHLNSMYPEVHSYLSKKLTEHMMKNKEKEDKKPPYKVRQALSLFLGSSLESSLTPMNMMAAQSVFIKQKAQQPVVASNSGLSKMGESFKTPEQAREQRLNK